MGYFCSFTSGSQGNSGVYVTENAKILVDAGTTARYITSCLACLGLKPSDLTHIAVTHCHSDHVSALPVLLKHTDARLVCSVTTYEYLNVNTASPILFEEGDGFSLGGVTVRTAATPHDCLGSCCYALGDGDGGIAICTDMGAVTAEVFALMRGRKNVFIEANHDLEMLKNGPYPYHLKKRILSSRGHLSNDDCGVIAARMALEGTSNITLAHLSRTNNCPQVAVDTVSEAMRRMDAPVQALKGVAEARKMKMIMEF